MRLGEIKRCLGSIGVPTEIIRFDDLLPDFNIEHNFFFIRSNNEIAESVYYFLKLKGLIPINEGAFENSFCRPAVKEKLSKFEIPNSNFYLIGNKHINILKKNKQKYMIKDMLGKPGTPTPFIRDYIDDSNNIFEAEYVDEFVEDVLFEYKVYVIGRNSFYSEKGENKAFKVKDKVLKNIGEKIGSAFSMQFYSFDILITQQGEYITIDINQNPSYRWVKNRGKIIAEEIRRIIDEKKTF